MGLPKGEVFLVPWTKNWGREYIKEKEKILDQIGKYTVAIHHIGSTAVKNLSAKPIIDIAIEIKDFHLGELCIRPLVEIGYSYKGTKVLPERHYFNKGEPRTHQIHMFHSGNEYLIQQLAFRDYLRSHEEARSEYEQLKFELSQIYKIDKHSYAEAKTDFIEDVMDRL